MNFAIKELDLSSRDEIFCQLEIQHFDPFMLTTFTAICTVEVSLGVSTEVCIK